MHQEIQRQNRLGHLATNHPNHVIWHEVGHAKFYRKHGWDHTRYENKPANFFGTAMRVSGYAASDPSEFVAEYFAATKLGKQYDQEVNDMYNHFVGEGGL
jgi:hypothetical protein